MNKINKILWLTWKDKKNPSSGGAELVNEQIAKRLAQKGYDIIFVVRGFEGGAPEEMLDGYKIVRLGRGWSLPFSAWRYYTKHLKDWPDLVIEEINTIPFLAKFYVRQKNILFFHQLCREVIFYQTFFPLSLIAYFIELLYLRLLCDRKVITVSESTKRDLLRHGFKKENIYIISEGTELEPLKELEPAPKIKQKSPTILFLSAIRPMKRPDKIINAFEIAKEKIKDLKLWLAGPSNKSRYFNKIIKLIRNSKFQKDITYWGRVNEEQKKELLKRAHIICASSVKEGWGLVIPEANSQETPAIVYNVDGLRDSVRHNQTGIVCKKNTPFELAQNIIKLLNDGQKYNLLRENAWEWSKNINFERSVADFFNILNRKIK